ncbi:MotA/TolQ/ExbB proton channel family protein [Candidatus Chrysopegis kryptomonas]|uniref:Biopolymer transport protein ExbB n=1 Tax=Candidatus Chryseopegocella kryptomonas TaxID=1633643 RepID=A0A0P1MS19_9BACT|nr:MotA/TolQ/ExbB proton channel family protein [Candidatus Chrysopegis kryptomonas]CUS98639.1 biopolymer transport protein ExbB [Candidatus Chrysopegis kryptomonas]
MRLLDLYLKGGVIMHLITISLVLMIYVVIEKFLTLRRAKANVKEFIISIRGLVKSGSIPEIIDYCNTHNTPISRIFKQGILKLGFGDEKVREAIEMAGRSEVFGLEKRLNILATIAGVAPLLGFLGTVTGMINAFMTIQALGGIVSPSDLAGGIWEALLTTAYGLIVGIPAYGLYNYFVTKINRLVHEIEIATAEFIDILSSEEFKNQVKSDK